MTSHGRRTPLMLLVGSAMVLGLPDPHAAFAQSASARAKSGGSSTSDTGNTASPAPPPGGMEQVVVTSAKRSQLINKVPESISVLSGKTLLQEHIQSYEDITRQTPGLSFAAGNTVSGGIVGPNTQNLVIRGISSTAGSATVALYLDDTSITQSNLYVGAELPRFVDMDRVEVLRGPQGTLFGASSMGGTIRLITNQPKFNSFGVDLTTDGSGTVHGGANWEEQGAVNIPLITDKLALRIAGDFGSNSGYINRLNPDGSVAKAGVNDEHWDFVRSTLKYRPLDDLDVTAQVLYQTDRTGDTPVFYPALGTYNEDKAVTEPSHDYFFVPSLTLRKYFPDFSVTSVSSYLQRTFQFQSDGTVFNSQVIADALLDPAFPAEAAQADSEIGTLPSQVHRDDRTYQASEELRAASAHARLFGRSLNWISGVYVEWQRQVRDDIEPASGISSAFDNIYGFPITQSQFGGAALGNLPYANYQNDVVYSDNQSIIQKQYAGFAQADYAILPRLKVTAGIRYSYATQNYFRSSGGVLAFGNAFPFTSSTSNYAATPKFSLAYDLDPESLVYATIAKGFRLGGPTGPVSGTTCQGDLAAVGISKPPTTYGPDRLWSYETGLKELLLHDRLSVNVGLYYIDWQNIQQTINLPTCGASITQNFGAAKSYGTEIEVRAKVAPGLTLSSVGGITRAIITQSPNDLAAAPGQDVLNVPKWTGTFAADYAAKLSRKLGFFARSDFDVIGSSHGAFNDQDPAFHQPRYGVLNGNMGLDVGRWVFTVYAKNLTNNKQIIQRPSINFVEEGYLLRPLTAGLMISTSF